MSTSVFLWTVSVIPLTVVVVFAMRYASAALQARTRRAEDAGYRAMAQAATTAQAETASALAALRSELAGVSASLASVETILRQVE